MRTDTILMVADFETTVYEGQTDTEVWSAACAFVYDDSENVTILGSIEDFFNYIFRMRKNIKLWFHNLKFDGTFIMDYLLRNGYRYYDGNRFNMPTKTFKALISSKRRFYSITIRTGKNCTITLQDSAKLVPFTLSEAADAFKTKHKKLEMEYKGRRYAHCPITLEEKMYIINDVLVLKELIEILLDRGMDKLTIGSVCTHDYKRRMDKWEFESYFPDLRNSPCEVDSTLTTETYVRKTYKGAWCYCKCPGKYEFGATYDVNSLYSSIMHSQSNNYYPVGQPHYFTGSIPEICKNSNIVWFVHIKCKFRLKPGYLPTLQIKNSFLYPATEWLKDSRYYFHGQYYDAIKDSNGIMHHAYPELYLTMRDYDLLLKHYEVSDLLVLDGCWFTGVLGLFDDYIDYWMDIKQNAKDKVTRTIAKLYLNNLYGKLASSDDASYLKPFIGKSDSVEYELVESNDKKVFYIPCGSMVTAYARYFTITHAQANYDIFLYADTDSIHCLDEPVSMIKIHPTKLLHWKKESEWDKAIFIRQKTYAERVFKDYPDGTTGLKWEVTCAGMPAKSKEIFMGECYKGNMTIEDFKVGLHVGGKLTPKNIHGGQILVERDFTLRKR